ncbi:MAG: FtsW/RodA/SpoVE family cell cycle protein, partial [Clostridia bacterium]|nr:FtsW/RodA/SpoVE family cell cycle protein [Clostridia bacterium]
MKSLALFKKKKGDFLIPIITVIIALFGVVMVYSASHYYAKTVYKDEYFFVKKQILGFVIGIIAMFFTSRIDY